MNLDEQALREYWRTRPFWTPFMVMIAIGMGVGGFLVAFTLSFRTLVMRVLIERFGV